MFEEDAVWDMRPIGAPGMEEYRGHAAIRRFFDHWLEVFPDSEIEVESVESRGEWGMSIVLQHVSGGSSGAPVPFRYYGIGHWPGGRMRLVENHLEAHRAWAAFERYTKPAVALSQAGK
jgi:SnoaL-like domain